MAYWRSEFTNVPKIMCLIAWNWQPHSETPLLLISNRDEFYARDTLPLHWWQPGPLGIAVLAGRDLLAGGTWLGVNQHGWMATLTNYRSPNDFSPNTPSRGALVTDFLQGSVCAHEYLQRLSEHASNYNGFNLLLYDGKELLGFQSRGSVVVPQSVGVGAVSNADFQTPWPKLQHLRQRLEHSVEDSKISNDALFALLQDGQIAPDELLPNTGIPLQRERELSPIFIASPEYGTRACSVVRIGRHSLEFTEHSYGPGELLGTQCVQHAW
jgi:uncharacterized protein with NRDE domain